MRYGIDTETLNWAEGGWKKIEIKMEAECRRLGAMMPYVPVNGSYEDMGEKELTAWTNGF